MLENIGLAKTFSEIFLQGDRSVSKAKMLFFPLWILDFIRYLESHRQVGPESRNTVAYATKGTKGSGENRQHIMTSYENLIKYRMRHNAYTPIQETDRNQSYPYNIFEREITVFQTFLAEYFSSKQGTVSQWETCLLSDNVFPKVITKKRVYNNKCHPNYTQIH